MKQDLLMLDLKNKLANILETNFNAISRYCQRFNEIKEFYYEDIKFDENIIRNNKQCYMFRKWYIRYKQEIDSINRIVNYQPLGIFLIQLDRYKNTILCAPRNKKNIIDAVISG